jgi:hypothetical protein
MASITDGVKIGLGIILLKWLLGLGGCLVTVATIGGLYCASQQSETEASGVVEQLDVDDSITWRSPCRVRSGPGAEFRRVGAIRVGRTYSVLERRGRWVRVAPGEWVGCRP